MPTFLKTKPAPANGLAGTYRTLRDAAAQAQRARVPQMAAALSYRTIFGLLPVVIVGLVLLKAFTTPKDLENLIKAVLDRSGLTAIVIDGGSDDADRGRRSFLSRWGLEGEFGPARLEQSPNRPPADEDASADAQHRSPGEGAPGAPTVSAPASAAEVSPGARRLEVWIRSLIDRVNQISLPALGLIGIGALLYAAVGMLVEIERAFNQIYRSPRGRSWSGRIVLYWTLLTLGPLGLFATFYVGNQAKALTEHVVLLLPGMSGEWGVTLVVAIGYVITVMISGAVLLLLYTAVPNAKVSFRAAIIGALCAAAALEAGKWGFQQYLSFTRGQSYVRLYGSIALFPLFLLWVYVTWVVVLMGLQVSYFLQHRGKASVMSLLVEPSPGGTAPALAVRVMTELARRFEKKQGEPPRLAELARAVELPDTAVAASLERLTRAGLTHRVSPPPEEGPDPAAGNAPRALPARARFALSRAPEAIRVAEIVRAALDEPPEAQASVPPVGPGYAPSTPAMPTPFAGPPGDTVELAARLRAAQVQAVGDYTLRDLLPAQGRAGGT
ncbi:MAG TPA: YhjD/YihY/BrkB family envelope integrity protein [Phycisphaerales bacterium]|nr:YhjD/YihY/BrkB family envelope integrity protein [Phycisphaerales bacterium]